MTIETRKFYVNKCPTKEIVADLDSPETTFKVVKETLTVKDGQVLVKNLYFSNDPSQRVWIQKNIPRSALYVEPIREGEAMRTLAIAQVVESKNPKYEAGDVVSVLTGWQELDVLEDAALYNKIPKSNIPLYAYLDVLGFTGLTAWFGITEVVKVKAEDVVVVSGAAGATGSMVVQLAKKVIGAKRVIGIAGGDAKCEFVKSIGADACLDYKKPNIMKQLTEALGPEAGVDVFFDGVGGTVLDNVVPLMNNHGKIIACGSVAGYNGNRESINTWPLITIKRLTVAGFIILDYLPKAQEAVLKIASYLKDGKITYNDDAVSLVDVSKNPEDFNKIPAILNMLFNGEKKNGKLITKVADAKL